MPHSLLDKAEAVLRACKNADESDVYMFVPSWPLVQPGSLYHTWKRFKPVGIDLYFSLLSSDDVHLPCAPSTVFRSPRGLPFPKLEALAQSFLDTHDMCSLADLVDGTNVTKEWGHENLDLDGTNDVEWARRKNADVKDDGITPYVIACTLPMARSEKRPLWEAIVDRKESRKDWKFPKHLFDTRFRLKGQPDLWLSDGDGW